VLSPLHENEYQQRVPFFLYYERFKINNQTIPSLTNMLYFCQKLKKHDSSNPAIKQEHWGFSNLVYENDFYQYLVPIKTK